MVIAAAPTFHASRLGLGAAALFVLYLVLLGGFVRTTAQAPASTVIYVSVP